jgi:DNA recombination protein RmuC
MVYVIAVIVGVAVGSVTVWVITRKQHDALGAKVNDAERRTATAEATLVERQKQYDELQRKADGLQASLGAESQARVKAETEKVEADRRYEDEKKLLAEAEKKLTDTFKALAGTTLDASTKAFLDLAKATFAKVVEEAKGDLGKKEEAIKGLVKPLADSLQNFETHVQGLEKSRAAAYANLDTQLKALAGTNQQLQKETTSLVTALKTPQVRGRWGEVTLKRVVELAGMSEHCDFTEQVSVATEGGRLRPDMIVHLPSKRDIVVDAKVALDAYLDAIAAGTDEQRNAAMNRHAKQMRQHMDALSAKNYWQQFDKTPEFVVMFIPGESFFAAAVDCDRALIEDGMAKQVILATPTTLISLLKAVAYGWRQEQIAENAKAVSELGRVLYERMATLADHIDKIGSGLTTATEAYNKAIGSIESRVLPSARKFRELGVTTAAEIGIIQPVDMETRRIDAPEARDGNTPEATE